MRTALLITGMIWGFVVAVVGAVSGIHSWLEESWHPLVEACGTVFIVTLLTIPIFVGIFCGIVLFGD